MEHDLRVNAEALEACLAFAGASLAVTSARQRAAPLEDALARLDAGYRELQGAFARADDQVVNRLAPSVCALACHVEAMLGSPPR